MAKVEVKRVESTRTRSGKVNVYYRYICVCSNCGNTIYAPAQDIAYNYCYSCGDKFETPVTNDSLVLQKKGKSL